MTVLSSPRDSEAKLRFLHRYVMAVQLTRTEWGAYACVIDYRLFMGSTAAKAIDAAYEHLLRMQSHS